MTVARAGAPKLQQKFSKIHHTAPYKFLRRARCHLELAPQDLGTRIAVTFQFLVLEEDFLSQIV
jgi:hypothetical protein